MIDPTTSRIIKEAMEASRNNTLDCAIEICDELARTGHGAECCLKALRYMRDILNPKMDS